MNLVHELFEQQAQRTPDDVAVLSNLEHYVIQSFMSLDFRFRKHPLIQSGRISQVRFAATAFPEEPSLSSECINGVELISHEFTERLIFDYIEVFHNRKRKLLSLSYMSPFQFESVNIV